MSFQSEFFLKNYSIFSRSETAVEENDEDVALEVHNRVIPSTEGLPSNYEVPLELLNVLSHLDQLTFSLECLIISRLEKLDVREKEIDLELKAISSLIVSFTPSVTNKNTFFIFGIPYFKTPRLLPYPPNDDECKKKVNGELISHELPLSNTWTNKDIVLIQNAAEQDIANRKNKRTVSHFDSPPHGPNEVTQKSQEKWSREGQEPFEELIPDRIGELDWFRISSVNFKCKFSPEECRRMWHLYAKPAIVKNPWCEKEDESLKSLVNIHKSQNWEAIAEELKTGRSYYQCLVQFMKRLHTSRTTGKWTREEDEKLCKIVECCRVGSYIPWTKVACNFETKTVKQLFRRYTNCLRPNLKKGPFSPYEDKKFRDGVQLYGKNFSKISLFLENRSVSQVRERYNNKNLHTMRSFWTKEEDLKLIKLVSEYGTNKWAQISKHFCRNRSQCRNRYLLLKNKHSPNLDPAKHHNEENSYSFNEKLVLKKANCHNDNEESWHEIFLKSSSVKNGRKKSNFNIENQFLEYFTEVYFDKCTVYKNGEIKSETKFKEAAVALKNLLTLLKANVAFPADMTENQVECKDTNQLADKTMTKIILHLARLYSKEESASNKIATVSSNQQFSNLPDVKSFKNITVRKKIECNSKVSRKNQLSPTFLCPKKSYNQASISALIYSPINEFYVEPQPKERLYSTDFQSALSSRSKNLLSIKKSNAKKKYQINNSANLSASLNMPYFVPPNVVSLLGLRTFMLARKKLWNMLSQTGQLKLPKSVDKNVNIDSFSFTKSLALSRCFSLLFWPLILSGKSPHEMDHLTADKGNSSNLNVNVTLESKISKSSKESFNSYVYETESSKSVRSQVARKRKRKTGILRSRSRSKIKSRKVSELKVPSNHSTNFIENND